MEERRKGKIMYNSDPQPPQAVQAQPAQTQHSQNLTIQQPRVIYGKPMPVSVQQELQQQNTRVIYVQPSPMVQMQVPGDPNLRTTYVLSNPNTDGAMKQEREVQLSDQNVRILYASQPMVQMQVADSNGRRITHLGLNTLQVNHDGSLVNREPVVCEVDLRQYQQMQVVHQQQQQQQQQPGEEHMRTTTGLPSAQFQGEMHAHVEQSHGSAVVTFHNKKKEKVLLPCCHCKDSFRTECQLQAHIRNKHIKPFKCDSCWKAFSFESQLKLHVTTHTGEKPYKCDVCPKAYARKTALFNHVRVHARKKFFKCCKYCGKGFKNEAKLEKHERMHSMSDERKYVSLDMYVEKPV